MPSRDKHPVVYDPRTGKLFSDPRLGGLDEINISMGGGGAVDSIAGQTGVVTLADINLDNVDNTSDADKPVSTAQQSAIDATVLSIDGQTGAVTLADINLDNVDNTSDASKPVSTAQQTALDSKANVSDLNTIEWTLTANGSSDYVFSGP